MEEKHTPGPWNNRGGIILNAPLYGEINCDLVWPEDRSFDIAWIPPGTNAKANARLIAAAPELMDALEAAQQWFADLVIDGDNWKGGSTPTLTQEMCDRCAQMQGPISAAIAKAKGEG